jgi:hypothetical protein
MSPPNPKRQRQAWETLEWLFARAADVWVIHYSCEGLYNRLDGRSPRVTSIAVRKLNSGQTLSFSIHQVAEREGVPFEQIDQHYDALERKMLDEFFQLVGSHRGMRYLHWNMRDINYGFAAIEHRHRVLGGEPFVIDDRNKFDLARILIDIYGSDYAGHRRLQQLLEKNGIRRRDFLAGAEEAAAFEHREFVRLHQSTLRKVDVLADLAGRAYHRCLRTDTTWWGMHGGRMHGFLHWLIEHRFITFLAGLASIAGFGISLTLL